MQPDAVVGWVGGWADEWIEVEPSLRDCYDQSKK